MIPPIIPLTSDTPRLRQQVLRSQWHVFFSTDLHCAAVLALNVSGRPPQAWCGDAPKERRNQSCNARARIEDSSRTRCLSPVVAMRIAHKTPSAQNHLNLRVLCRKGAQTRVNTIVLSHCEASKSRKNPFRQKISRFLVLFPPFLNRQFKNHVGVYEVLWPDSHRKPCKLRGLRPLLQTGGAEYLRRFLAVDKEPRQGGVERGGAGLQNEMSEGNSQ